MAISRRKISVRNERRPFLRPPIASRQFHAPPITHRRRLDKPNRSTTTTTNGEEKKKTKMMKQQLQNKKRPRETETEREKIGKEMAIKFYLAQSPTNIFQFLFRFFQDFINRSMNYHSSFHSCSEWSPLRISFDTHRRSSVIIARWNC